VYFFDKNEMQKLCGFKHKVVKNYKSL